MNHAFNAAVAAEYGVNEALLLTNIHFWVELNRRNGRNLHDGDYWTFLTVESMCGYFSYLSERTVRNALKKLKENGLIKVGRYNKKAYDRTNWYTLTPKGARFYAIRSKMPDGSGHFDRMDAAKRDVPIPDINKYIINKEERPQKPVIREWDNVRLTEAQYAKLVGRFGKEEADLAVDYLDKYIARCPAAFADHYLAVLRWAYPAMTECARKKRQAKIIHAKTFMELAEDINAIQKKEEKER